LTTVNGAVLVIVLSMWVESIALPPEMVVCAVALYVSKSVAELDALMS